MKSPTSINPALFKVFVVHIFGVGRFRVRVALHLTIPWLSVIFSC